MIEIIPAIIAKSFDELKEKIKLVEPYVKSVQIDIMDGIFVSEKTWNSPKELKNISANLEIEAHLMVEDAESEVDRWLGSGVKRILIHYEALAGDLRFTIYDLREKLEKKGIEFGLVLNLETPISVLDEFSELFLNLKSSIVIQLMSIAQIGSHGQPFDEKVIPKIRALREWHPSVKIQADGGINAENAKQVAEAGADILVIGSAIFGSENVGGAIEELKKMIDKQ